MNAHEIDQLTPAQMDTYWRGKSNEEFVAAARAVQVFVGNPANMECARNARPGMFGKAAIAVAEGMTLTKQSWGALFGYGREYAPSFRSGT